MPTAQFAETYALVADIGGTNTRVGLAKGDRLLSETVRKFRNAEFADLDTVLRTFLSGQNGVDCSGACVAVAGPVRDGIGELTNLNWTMDDATLARATGAGTVSILNDLQAQGHALHKIPAANLRRIIAPRSHGADAPSLVIGVGTGFNVAPVYPVGDGRLVTPSETGHTSMPVRDDADFRLHTYLEKTHGTPAVEDVLSGRGLERIYAWLCHESGQETQAQAAEIFAAFEAGTDPVATKTARMFTRLLGTIAGDMALIHLPFAGIYLAGGVARAFAPHLNDLGFREAFHDKGRFADFMDNFAVASIEDDFAALSGCASYLAKLG